MTCPERVALEECAGGVPMTAALRDHLRSCGRCAALVDQIEAENTFLRNIAGGQELTRPASARDDTAAFELPGYTIVRQLHRGGQGVVFHAIQESTQRDVAIKVMREGLFAGVSDRARFDREVQLLAQLDHPNIVTIYDSGVSAGYCYFVMDLVEGVPLDQWLHNNETASVRDRVALFARICEAVNAAHVRGVIHRDLKPGNILICDEQTNRDDATERRSDQGRERSGSSFPSVASSHRSSVASPKILDFGLAKETIREDSRADMTLTGQFLGTPAWASPEQAGGDPARVDMRSDVYTLGVILFVILTGEHPYPVSRNLREMMERIQSKESPAPSEVAAGLDHEIDTIALKCLAKEPERRYQTAGELGRDVRRYLADEPIEAKRDSALYVLGKVVSRYRGLLRLSAAFGFVLLGLIYYLWFLRSRESDMRRAAQQSELRASARADEAETLRRHGAIESGRALAIADNVPMAERILWPEFLKAGGDLSGPHWRCAGREYWALAQLYALHPCEATLALPGSATRFSCAWAGDDELVAAQADGVFYRVEPVRLKIRDKIQLPQAAADPTPRLGVILPPGGTYMFIASPAGVRALRPDSPEWSAFLERPADAKEWRYLMCGVNEIGYVTTADTIRVHRLTPSGFDFDEEFSNLDSIGPRQFRFLEDPSKLWILGKEKSYLMDRQTGEMIGFEAEPSVNATIASNGRLVFAAHGALRTCQIRESPNVVQTTPKVHVGSIRFTRLSSDGSRLVTIDNTSSSIHLWEMPAVAEMKRFYGHTSLDVIASFKPDASSLVSLCGDGLLKRWALPGHDPVARIFRASTTVISGAFSRDGQRMFLGSEREFFAGDISGPVEPLRAWPGIVAAIEMSPDGRFLAIADYEGVVSLCDPQTLAVIESRSRVRTPTDRVDQIKFHDVTFHPSGEWLAVAADDRAVYRWNLRTGEWDSMLQHGAGIPSVQFSGDGKWLASSDRAADVILWKVPEFDAYARWNGGDNKTRAIAFCREDKVLACGDESGRVRLWDVETRSLLSLLDGHSAPIFALAAQPGGALLASGDSRGVIIVWDCVTGVELIRFREHKRAIFSLSFSPDGRYLLSTSDDRSAALRDLAALERRVAGNAEAALQRFGMGVRDNRAELIRHWVNRQFAADPSKAAPTGTP